MKGGIVSFIVLMVFIPGAIHVVALYREEMRWALDTSQFLLEQQAITAKEQDLEESFWRVVSAGGPLGEWAGRMGVEIWYGDSLGPGYGELAFSRPKSFDPPIRVVDGRHVSIAGGKYDAIGALIESGSSRGIYLIPAGCGHELP